MRRSKPGLADLKALRRQAQAPEQPPSPPASSAGSVARKRAPFLPPSAGPKANGVGPDVHDGGNAGKSGTTKQRSAEKRTYRGAAMPPVSHAASGASAAAAAALLTEADRRLFRSAVRYVDKLKEPGRAMLPPVATAPADLLKERRMRAAGIEQERARRRPALMPDTPTPATPTAKPLVVSDSYVSAAHDHNDAQYLKAGHGSDIIRDLKRGKWPIGASLDLHGSTLEDARERFERFVASCLAHEVKCVRIVHGKGYGSRDGDSVLKTAVRRWLTQLADVIAYTECAPADGGSGAVQVLLK